jgi:hypothetical protein
VFVGWIVETLSGWKLVHGSDWVHVFLSGSRRASSQYTDSAHYSSN